MNLCRVFSGYRLGGSRGGGWDVFDAGRRAVNRTDRSRCAAGPAFSGVRPLVGTRVLRQGDKRPRSNNAGWGKEVEILLVAKESVSVRGCWNGYQKNGGLWGRPDKCILGLVMSMQRPVAVVRLSCL